MESAQTYRGNINSTDVNMNLATRSVRCPADRAGLLVLSYHSLVV